MLGIQMDGIFAVADGTLQSEHHQQHLKRYLEFIVVGSVIVQREDMSSASVIKLWLQVDPWLSANIIGIN